MNFVCKIIMYVMLLIPGTILAMSAGGAGRRLPAGQPAAKEWRVSPSRVLDILDRLPPESPVSVVVIEELFRAGHKDAAAHEQVKAEFIVARNNAERGEPMTKGEITCAVAVSICVGSAFAFLLACREKL